MTYFQCQICLQKFTSLAQSLDHVYSHRSSQNSCVVPGCGRNSARLTKHLKASHRKLCEYPCSLCPKRVFVREYDIRMHSKALHGGNISVSYHGGVHDTGLNFSSSTSTTPNLSMFNPYHHPTTEFKTADLNETGFDFKSPKTSSDLNTFIDDHLQPTEEFNTEMKKTVDNICKFLQEHIRPNQIVKGGSLGKGTAVKGRCDIDLVLVLNGVKDAKDLKGKLPGIKREVVDKLKGSEAKDFIIVNNQIKETTYLLNFIVQGRHGNIDVDLLPTFHFDHEDLNSLYNDMKDDKDNAEFYSVSLAEQQVEFVRRIPANLKNLIRLVKYWKKEKVKVEKAPSSYVIELITIHLWETQSRGRDDWTFNTLKAFHGVMTALKNYRLLYVVWKENYSVGMIPPEIRQERPFVLDPANPMNNVCKRFSWDEIKEAAEELLQGRMLRGISSDNWE